MINLDDFRLHPENKLLILDYLELFKISVYKVTRFGLIPPDLREIFDKPGYYYHWFIISETFKENWLQDKITINLSNYWWVDTFQRQIIVRKKTLPEIIQWCEKILDEEYFIIEDENSSLCQMINIFDLINAIVQTDNGQAGDIPIIFPHSCT